MASPEATPELKTPVGDRDHAQGPPDAPVTLVEYGDYECPHCRQVHPITKELRERFGDRLRYVFRHFPITSMHPHAQMAAEAAEAAAAQGKFWEMHNLLLERETLDREHLVQYAAELGLDTDRFEGELNEGIHAESVRDNLVGGVRSGANGTPAFFINGLRYDGAWDLASMVDEIDKPLGVRVRVMFQQFSRLQASGGILLLAATIVALIWANSAGAQTYFALWDTKLTLSLGNLTLSESLLHWINDGLMVIFFFVVGLEIKREFLIGELASPRRAALPLMAAVGVCSVPAAIYFAFNAGRPSQQGWGIPMATDIAFMLTVLTVLGSRVPVSLKVFFTALAIADDIGAVLVITFFYSGEIVLTALLVAVVLLLGLIILNRASIRNPLPYGLLGVGLWLAFLESGIHPTIAGVLLAMTIPARTRVRAQAFSAQCTAALRGFGAAELGGDEIVASHRQQAAAQTLETIAERIQTPLQRLERSVTPWATYLILPIFALANAGVTLRGDPAALVTSPIFLGITAGLVLGKPLGITMFAWLAVKLRIAQVPAGVTWRELFGASWLAGIGFTMSLFIANAALSDPDLLDLAELSILIASLIAAIVGAVLLYQASSEDQVRSELHLADSSA